MNSTSISNIYLIGIGGIGMSALARFFKAMGKEVSGYDKTPSSLTDELIAEGIRIHFEDNVQLIPENITNPKNRDNVLVIYTPAIPANHSELEYMNRSGFHILKRSEVLGEITKDNYTVAIGGTHGKTTTSTIIAHILKTAGVDCTAFLGGISVNYHTNLILSKTGTTMVVEADEYDRSFLTLHPQIAVITSMDADHLDIYQTKEHLEESYKLFARKVKKGGMLIYKQGLPLHDITDIQCISYSLHEKADFTTANIKIEDGEHVFDIICPKAIIKQMRFGYPGLHNVENALAAIAVAISMNISESNIREALETFKGVHRRFEFHIKEKDIVYIDDYAHHPEELRACITSVKELYPGKKIIGIFQPHLFTRTRDFADGFAQSLALLDELILLEIYPARELPIEGINSRMLLDKVKMKNKMLCTNEELMEELSNRKSEVVLTLGAGDIDRLVEPIKNLLDLRLKLTIS